MADATDEDYRNWAIALNRIEDEIKAKNEEKRNLYVEIRNSFSPTTANALKDAMKLCRMDKGKRDEALELHQEARRVLAILMSSPSQSEEAPDAATPVVKITTVDGGAVEGADPTMPVESRVEPAATTIPTQPVAANDDVESAELKILMDALDAI